MSRILTVNNHGFATFAVLPRTHKRANLNGRILSMKGKKTKEGEIETQGSASLSVVSACFILAIAVLSAGAFYLYQVNDLATKGYEMKAAESRIADLEKQNKDMEIKGVELRSMYNIEKSTQDLNLVNTQNVSYVEMNSPVAMK